VLPTLLQISNIIVLIRDLFVLSRYVWRERRSARNSVSSHSARTRNNACLRGKEFATVHYASRESRLGGRDRFKVPRSKVFRSMPSIARTEPQRRARLIRNVAIMASKFFSQHIPPYCIRIAFSRQCDRYHPERRQINASNQLQSCQHVDFDRSFIYP